MVLPGFNAIKTAQHPVIRSLPAAPTPLPSKNSQEASFVVPYLVSASSGQNPAPHRCSRGCLFLFLPTSLNGLGGRSAGEREGTAQEERGVPASGALARYSPAGASAAAPDPPGYSEGARAPTGPGSSLTQPPTAAGASFKERQAEAAAAASGRAPGLQARSSPPARPAHASPRLASPRPAPRCPPDAGGPGSLADVTPRAEVTFSRGWTRRSVAGRGRAGPVFFLRGTFKLFL